MKISINLTAIKLSILTCGLIAFAGCGKNLPPDSLVVDALNKKLPPVVKIGSVTVEESGAKNSYNFKVKLALKEDFYVPVSSPEPQITLLRQTSKEGDILDAYGKFEAEKVVDHWNITDITLTNIANINSAEGNPRSHYKNSYIAGTPEAEKAVRDIKLARETAEAAEQERYAKAQKAAQLKDEENKRIAAEEKAKIDAENKAILEKITTAIAAGTKFEGLILWGLPGDIKGSEPINASITKNNGRIVEIEIRSPTDVNSRVSMSGTIVFPNKEPDLPIQFHGSVGTGKNWLYKTSPRTRLQLGLTVDNTIEGDGYNSGGNFLIKLKAI